MEITNKRIKTTTTTHIQQSTVKDSHAHVHKPNTFPSEWCKTTQPRATTPIWSPQEISNDNFANETTTKVSKTPMTIVYLSSQSINTKLQILLSQENHSISLIFWQNFVWALGILSVILIAAASTFRSHWISTFRVSCISQINCFWFVTVLPHIFNTAR